MTEMHPATVWERMADELGDHPAIIQGDTVRTWAGFEANASRMAGALGGAGIGHDDKVGVYLQNCPEYLEIYFAAFKARALPVNINYRYVEDELDYLINDSDASALVFDEPLAGRVDAVAATSDLALRIQVGGGSAGPGCVTWQSLLASSDEAPRQSRSEEDLHILYTGGTTGMPKGVLYVLGGLARELASLGAPVVGAVAPTSMEELVAAAVAVRDDDRNLVTLVLPPLMHGTGMALALITLLWGGTTVLLPPGRLDPEAALAAIQENGVQVLNLVGDAFGRPLVAALEAAEADGRAFDLSSLTAIMSSGAMLSSEIKDALLARAPQAMIIDTLAASEAPMGTSISMAGVDAETAKFSLRPGTVVFDDHDLPLTAGSGSIGHVGVATENPIGYYNDPVKTAKTFRTIDGVRYSFPGDMATVEVDGSIRLLGRGNHCIISGGEKIFPEEVEEALKTHANVTDALSFGVEDERWGERIEAVVSVSGATSEPELVDHVRERLAVYKAPKAVHVVEEVPRAPNGKADYERARALAGALSADRQKR